jgi:hypothetical protein
VVHVNWRDYSAGNTGVAAAVGISSERGLSKQQEVNGKNYAD